MQYEASYSEWVSFVCLKLYMFSLKEMGGLGKSERPWTISYVVPVELHLTVSLRGPYTGQQDGHQLEQEYVPDIMYKDGCFANLQCRREYDREYRRRRAATETPLKRRKQNWSAGANAIEHVACMQSK